MKKAFKILIFVCFLTVAFGVEATVVRKKLNFNIDSSYDLSGRSELSATLVKESAKLYFYADEKWWNETITPGYQNEVKNALGYLAEDFENKTYPLLTATFGTEWKAGIDNDDKITVLIHPMLKNAGGYFNSGDEYSKTQNPSSNEREMIYLNSEFITGQRAKGFLAHEFCHLITFNQKERILGVEEEVWLNEARSEYAPTLAGFDDVYIESNLQKRVNDFLGKSYNSLTEWENEPSDYGAANLFIQYLVDHYGVKILKDSLKSNKAGIASLNYALAENGFDENFSQIFTDWTIAIAVNDCKINGKYCYLNKNLKNLKVTPLYNFLPLVGKSTLSVIATTQEWAGNWHKFFGGNGILKLTFSTSSKEDFKIPYLVEDSQSNFSIGFLTFSENADGKREGTIYIKDFGKSNVSLMIIPHVRLEISQAQGFGRNFGFSWVASTVDKTPEEEKAEEELINQLLAKIAELQAKISEVQAKIDTILGKKTGSCQKLESDLYYGMKNNSSVNCLQDFLKSQGSEIYPEGLVTGNFLSLTKEAVIRFQQKYANEILAPLGLEKGTGFVGLSTRTKINGLLKLTNF